MNQAIRPMIIAALLLLMVLHPASAAAENKYQALLAGSWEIEGEAEIFVLDSNNSCYRMDEDGIKTSKRGRWAADAKRLTLELKYNGKKYRTIFKYEMVSKDHFALTIIKALVDGKPKKPKKNKVVAKRWKK